MKLAYLIYRYGAGSGGVERYVYDLTSAMLARGHEVHLFTSETRGVQDGVFVHIVPVNRFASATKVTSFARNCAAMLRDEKYDVVHGFSRTDCQDVYRIGGGSHMRYLVATHRLARTAAGRAILRLNPRNRAIIELERRRYGRGGSCRLTAISRLAKGEIVEDFGVEPDAITVIYNPVDTARFSPQNAAGLRESTRASFGIDDKKLVALFVGTGFRRKGLDLMVTGLSTLKEADRPFLLVAGRDDPRWMKRRAWRLGVEGNLIFAGNAAKIEALYGAADYLVFPSLSDAFGQVVLESMACGLPALVSGLAGASEIIDHGRNGYLVADPRRVTDLAAAMMTMEDGERRRAMAVEAARTAAQYTLVRNVEHTLVVYGNVIEDKRRNGRAMNQIRR